MRRMKSTFNNFLTVIFAFFSVLFLACPDNPEPEPTTCEYPAGNRTFTWRVDTVAWFGTSTVAGVWAFSDDDAYVMGGIIDGKPPYSGRFGRHWNGETWEDDINGTWGYNDVTEEWGDISIGPLGDVTGDDHFKVAVGYWGINQNIYAGIAEFDNRIKKWKSYQLQGTGELRSVWTDGKGFFIAVGDNGMVYTKDGYKAEWVYSKAPTEFSFYSITGVSNNEIYACAYQSLATGEFYQQGWKYRQDTWTKLYDTKDTTGTPLHLTVSDWPNGMGVWRCGITDSLILYVVGDQSYRFEGKGQQLDFQGINLSDIGLPLKQNGRTGQHVFVFNPNDVWITGTRYNFYHWNGTNFQRIFIPGLPDDDTRFGFQLRFVKTETGKIFIPSEISSQVYVVVQGTP